MEITMYHTIARLVEQMMTSHSFENKWSAVIELNKMVLRISWWGAGIHKSSGWDWRVEAFIFQLVKMLEPCWSGLFLQKVHNGVVLSCWEHCLYDIAEEIGHSSSTNILNCT